MSFWEKLFGIEEKPQKKSGDELQNGDIVSCGECGKKLKVKYFSKGGITT